MAIPSAHVLRDHLRNLRDSRDHNSINRRERASTVTVHEAPPSHLLNLDPPRLPVRVDEAKHEKLEKLESRSEPKKPDFKPEEIKPDPKAFMKQDTSGDVKFAISEAKHVDLKPDVHTGGQVVDDSPSPNWPQNTRESRAATPGLGPRPALMKRTRSQYNSRFNAPLSASAGNQSCAAGSVEGELENPSLFGPLRSLRNCMMRLRISLC